MRITWFGTASLGVETAAGRLLIDPYYPVQGSPTRVPESAYLDYDDILVTHGHFDHIMSLPRILRQNRARVRCTATPRETLLAHGVPEEQIMPFKPGDCFEVQGMRVRAYQSRHVKYDGAILRRTLLNARMLRYAGNLPEVLYGFLKYPENGETVGFLIEGDGRSLFAMGSLNLDDATEYPTGMDLLALPYQGTSDLLTPAMGIIDRLKPKAVLLDHFDDAFPPISNSVDTSDIEARLSGVLPLYRLAPGQSVKL